jgi:hypothetical protein
MLSVSFKYSQDGSSAKYSNARFAQDDTTRLKTCSILSDSAALSTLQVGGVHAITSK